MKVRFSILVVVWSLCLSHCIGQDFRSFNRASAEFFLEHKEMIDLSPLDQAQRCVLENAISHDLDAMNSLSLTIINDHLAVRSYFEEYLHLHFAFVHDLEKSKIYFLAIPELNEWIYGLKRNYVQEADTLMRLRLPKEVHDINLALLMTLVSGLYPKKIVEEVEFAKQVRSLRELLFASFPLLRNNLSSMQSARSGRLAEGLPSRSLLELEQRLLPSQFRQADIFEIEDTGFLFLFYEVSAQLNLELSASFVPSMVRQAIVTHSATSYKECLKLR